MCGIGGRSPRSRLVESEWSASRSGLSIPRESVPDIRSVRHWTGSRKAQE